jgi:hypothetical protein
LLRFDAVSAITMALKDPPCRAEERDRHRVQRKKNALIVIRCGLF